MLPFAMCLSLLVAGAPTRARAQGDDTKKALTAYRLTMPTVRKLIEAGNTVKRGPDAGRLESETERIHTMSIPQLMTVYDGLPSMKRAIAVSGIAPREFATAALSLAHAYRRLTEEGMAKATGRQVSSPLPWVPTENVELVQKNAEEIERLNEK